MKIAVVGATGLVGGKILEVLKERNFPVTGLIPVASEKSKGKIIPFDNKEYKVCTAEEAVSQNPDIAIFSAGGGTSRHWAPKFSETGTYVIDNSSAWRMDDGIKLIVPEINGNEIQKTDRIIANPNCSTIQLVVALAPLYKKFGINRIIVSTYQSISGSGIKAVKQLEYERQGDQSKKYYPHSIDMNCLPHCDDFETNGYTKEELKIVNETRKIFDDYTIGITSTAVRVPVKGGHSESVYVEFDKDYTLAEVKELLKTGHGIELQDNPAKNIYPMPINAENNDMVYVGRLRQDLANVKGLNMWVVSDNLRKGAATNAVQIAEIVAKKFF